MSSIAVEVTTPPTIGVAMRFITSAPAPWLQRIGMRPAMMTAAVIAFIRYSLFDRRIEKDIQAEGEGRP